MRQNDAFFGEQELALIYIAKRLKEAQRLERALDDAGVDYLVEADTYRGGFLFVSERIGAFFYVTDESVPAAEAAMQKSGFQPYKPETGQIANQD